MIETARLVLRPPVSGDVDALHAMWRDPAVMADLGQCKSRDESIATIARHDGYRAEHGTGFWSVIRRSDDAVIGFCGLKPGAPDTLIAGELEIGWMLGSAYWGSGYAREAAEASLDWGWRNRPEARIVAITAATNLPSQALMARLGMQAFARFEHPLFAVGDRLRDTIAYAVARP